MINPSELRAIRIEGKDKMNTLYHLQALGTPIKLLRGKRCLVGQRHIDWLKDNGIPYSVLEVEKLEKELEDYRKQPWARLV